MIRLVGRSTADLAATPWTVRMCSRARGSVVPWAVGRGARARVCVRVCVCVWQEIHSSIPQLGPGALIPPPWRYEV